MKRLLGQPLPKCQCCGAGFKRLAGASVTNWRKQKYCGRECADKMRGADWHKAAQARAVTVHG